MVTSAWMIYYLNFNWNKGKTSKLNKYEKIFTKNIIKKKLTKFLEYFVVCPLTEKKFKEIFIFHDKYSFLSVWCMR